MYSTETKIKYLLWAFKNAALFSSTKTSAATNVSAEEHWIFPG